MSQDFVLSVAMTPDAEWVMSGSKDRGVQFWNPRTGDTQLMLQGHKNSGETFNQGPSKNILFANHYSYTSNICRSESTG